jgi:phosphate:Na+ symporter
MPVSLGEDRACVAFRNRPALEGAKVDDTAIDFGSMTVSLLGGLAIFLFGLNQLTDMLKSTAGGRMSHLLARATDNRFKGVLAGSLTTAVIQSSSVTTVLTVGFVSAGLMSLQQSIGIIMGAGIGTTVTAQIIAFKITRYALVAVTIGFVLQFFFENDRVKRYGSMVLGLGLVFYGMNLMGDATHPLRSYQPFIELLAQMDNRWLTILLSAGFTALIQSSSATTGVIIVLGSQGLISLEQGIALVFGANIGTCITALLASIGKHRLGLRTALVHVTFNVAGVLLWFGFIDELAELSRWLSPAAVNLSGVERIAADMPRQIANAHTLFNVTNTLVFIWFTGGFAWFVSKLLPIEPPTGPSVVTPRYLNSDLVDTPALALDAARMEIVRMAGRVLPMVREAAPTVLVGLRSGLEQLRDLDADVDLLHAAIVRYLGRVSREELSPGDTERLHDYLNIATLYESIGDIVETDLVHDGMVRLERDVQVSSETRRIMSALAEKVIWAHESATDAVDRDDPALAREVIAAKEDVNRIAERIGDRLIARLVAEDPHRTSTFRVESQLIEHFERIYYFARRIAKLVAEADTVDDRAQPEREAAA